MVSAKEDLTIGLLSWKAHQTLEKTLASYAEAGLTSLAARSFIFFNSITDEDRAIAAKYGWEALGSERNLGIWGGMDAIAAEAKTKYVLFLQNDCPVVVSSKETHQYIEKSVQLVETGRADMVQLRHRFNRGNGYRPKKLFRFHHIAELDERYLIYDNVKLPVDAFRDTFFRKMMRFFRPFEARTRLRGLVYLEKKPERIAPDLIVRQDRFLVIDSSLINFSEQPFLVANAFYKKLSAWCGMHKRHRRINGFPVMEHSLNVRWWRLQHFKIAVGEEGVFTHARWDDSWRRNHAAYNAKIVTEDKH